VLRIIVALAVIAWLHCACGPSTAQIVAAKSARYSGQPSEIFNAVEEVILQDYKIGDRQSEPKLLTVMTAPQWYTPEGGRQSPGAGDYVQLSDRSVQLSLKVEVLAASNTSILVEVTPQTLQYLSGSPQPRELRPDDPNLPPWINGRVDSLYVAINERLKPFENK
jgi:hypothetical protein